MKMEPLTLTRYLYIKQDVMASLLVSILEKDTERSLFWAHELYFSGFEEELNEYLHSIYLGMFYPYNPKLKKLIDICIFKYKPDCHNVETIILNLTARPRKFSLQAFMSREHPIRAFPNAAENETNVLIFSKLDGSCMHDNSHLRVDKVLQERCTYATNKNMMKVLGIDFGDIADVHTQHQMNWEYYASFSPEWTKRIHEYHGMVNHETKRINFENDDYFEAFYEAYGYDLDEQPDEVMAKLIHCGPEPQLTELEFYKMYDVNAKVITHTVKKNKLSQSSEQTEHLPTVHP